MQQGGDQINRDQNNNTLKQQEEQRQNKEMSAAIMQQPTFRRTHEEGKLPSLSSMLPPLPPFNPRLMTSPKDRFGRSSFRNYSEDGGQLPSFMSGERLSPPSQRSPQIGFSNSPPLSAKTRIGSDNYSIEEASSASSSSLRAPSQHIYRSRTRSSAMPYEVGLPSPSAMDIFHQLWDMMLEIRRHYEHIQSNNSSIGPRPLPSIRDGDVTTLMSHLQYEIDILSEHDARVADHYALDVRHLYEQYMNQSQQQQQNRSARGSSTSVPHRRGQSQFGNSQPVHCSSSLSPPTYTLSASAPRSRQITPSSSSVGNEHMYSVTAPASAPAYGRNQEGFQQSNVYDHVGKSQIGSWYDNRHISSAPPSPQDNVRQSTVAGSYYHHAISGRTPPSMPRRVRKRRDEAEQSCLSCSAKETPEWRKGPTGPRTLCNACGLLFAKQCRKREMELQARGKRPKGARVIGPEEMTQEERENSLLELQMAVQARVNQTTSNVSGLPTMATSSTSPSPGGMTSMNGNHTSHPNYFNSHPNHHSHHHHPQPPPPQQQQQHQHQHPSQHNNHRLYGSPSLERSPPSATGNAGGGSSGDHHISLPRLMSDQSHPPPPSLPPLLRH